MKDFFAVLFKNAQILENLKGIKVIKKQASKTAKFSKFQNKHPPKSGISVKARENSKVSDNFKLWFSGRQLSGLPQFSGHIFAHKITLYVVKDQQFLWFLLI